MLSGRATMSIRSPESIVRQQENWDIFQLSLASSGLKVGRLWNPQFSGGGGSCNTFTHFLSNAS
jgi:hypothetical protein